MTETMLLLAKDFNAPYISERSFKLSRHEMLDNRLLLSFLIRNLGSDPRSALAHVCGTLDLPAAYRPVVESHFREADNIHLGYEEGSGVFVYKLYLEFARRFRKQVSDPADPQAPVLLHLAFKWDPNCDSHRTIARYTCRPRLTPTEMQRRLSESYGNRTGGVPNTVEIGNPLPPGEGRVREKTFDLTTNSSQTLETSARTLTPLPEGEELNSTTLPHRGEGLFLPSTGGGSDRTAPWSPNDASESSDRSSSSRSSGHLLPAVEGYGERTSSAGSRVGGGEEGLRTDSTALGGGPHRAASRLLQQATQRMPTESLFFLEVEEEGNPRRSFDMCLYDASFSMHEIEPELAAIVQYFQIPQARFRQTFDPVRHEKLGHLSGGVGRNGREFCTFYYGARRHLPARPREGNAVELSRSW